MIDVSNYQQTIDWHKVKRAGVERAYVKLGEDGIGIDAYAVANIHHARAARVQVGLYWFAHPGHHTPGNSAAAFLSLAHGHLLAGDLPPALDLEVEEGLSLSQLDWWKGTWFKPVDAAIRTRAVFYSFRYMLAAMTLYPDRPVWGAHPGTLTAAERERWAFWQYGTERVPGIAGAVDLDEALHPERIPTIPAPAL